MPLASKISIYKLKSHVLHFDPAPTPGACDTKEVQVSLYCYELAVKVSLLYHFECIKEAGDIVYKY